MDYTQAIANLTSLIGQKQNEIDALTQAKTVLENGFILQQEKINAEVNAQKAQFATVIQNIEAVWSETKAQLG